MNNAGNGEPTLQAGSQGPAVRRWQCILARSGIVLGASGVDGQFGPGTVQATKTWQAQRGLTADGVVGPRTWAAGDGVPALRCTAGGVSLGLDVGIYPGDGVMKALKSAYAFTGFYLPGAPEHGETSWKGKWPTLRDLGFGATVIYVGRQQASSLLSAPQGTTDAKDALGRAQSEGFAANSVVFLDVEYADAMSSVMRDYVGAWLEAVSSSGTYRPGVYCHVHNLADVQSVASPLASVAYWICGGGEFSMAANPGDCGLSTASVWQGWLDSGDPSQTVDFPIDVSLATSSHPSGA